MYHSHTNTQNHQKKLKKRDQHKTKHTKEERNKYPTKAQRINVGKNNNNKTKKMVKVFEQLSSK